MSFTFKDSDGANGSGSSSTIVSPGLTVAAGDIVVVMVGWEGTDTTIAVSDGTTTLTPWSIGNKGTAGSNGEPHLAMSYLLASVASGTNTVVYTATYGAARTFRTIAVYVFTPSAAASIGGSPNCSAGSGTTGTALASGNITTTGMDGLAVAAYSEYGGTLDGTQKINGVDDVGTQLCGTSHSCLYYIAYAAEFTGQATAGIGSNNRWVLGVIAFKIGAAAGLAVPVVTRQYRARQA